MSTNNAGFQSFALWHLPRKFLRSPKTNHLIPDLVSMIQVAIGATSQYLHRQFPACNTMPDLAAVAHQRYDLQDIVKSFFKLLN